MLDYLGHYKKYFAAIAIGFMITCCFAMVLASDLGESVQHQWAGIWCPSKPSLPSVLMNGTTAPAIVQQDDYSCHERIMDATSNMISICLCLLTASALVVLLKAYQSNNGH